MRTRSQSNRHRQSSSNDNAVRNDSESGRCSESLDDSGTLSNISRKAVGKLLRRVNLHGSPRMEKQDSYPYQCDSVSLPESRPKSDRQDAGTTVTLNTLRDEGCSRDITGNTPGRREEMDESDWEDGSIPNVESTKNSLNYLTKGLTIELSGSTDSAKRKPVRRASAEDKELAELVHKVHLLCLLARGRLVDGACNDPLIQASLLSLLPTYCLKAPVSKLTAKALDPIVNWFHNNFSIRSPSNENRSPHSALAFALEAREGTPEEITALFVALLRALHLTTRFVSILDVASLKPGVDKSGSVSGGGLFQSSTLMVARSNQVSTPVKSSLYNENDYIYETPPRGVCKSKDCSSTSKKSQCKVFPIADQLNDEMSDILACKAQNDIPESCIVNESRGLKRKGDIEFERQLEMALSATSVATHDHKTKLKVKDLHTNSSNSSSPLGSFKRIKGEGDPSSSHGITTALGSRKVGPPLYWAEVYCDGENQTGKWVHVDAVNVIIDGEKKVEAAAAACKISLRYVVAFAGNGAKDVTRRYCMKWYKIAKQRISSSWWDTVLKPLKELESGATAEHVRLLEKLGVEESKEYGTRNSLEDLELETRALTEPLPTNQQAYKNHPLYAIERWLTKYQTLYPKGPVLGFCSGHPVYPRTSVKTLKTKQRWLREALQVKINELPAKVLKQSQKSGKVHSLEADDDGEGEGEEAFGLYGEWQTEPLQLPYAVNGIVPRNERGQVDVWSEKCLPHGTVHLRLPRLVPVVQRLGVDFAPAMVGFEFRNGKSYPLYEGLVVCAEFKDAVLEAYAEEEERREAEEEKKNELQAISRWYQLLSSIVTRQRLNNRYGEGASVQTSSETGKTNRKLNENIGGSGSDGQYIECSKQGYVRDTELDTVLAENAEDHQHVFLTEDQSFDEESSVRTKRCRCGFSVEVEEM